MIDVNGNEFCMYEIVEDVVLGDEVCYILIYQNMGDVVVEIVNLVMFVLSEVIYIEVFVIGNDNEILFFVDGLIFVLCMVLMIGDGDQEWLVMVDEIMYIKWVFVDLIVFEMVGMISFSVVLK